MFEVGQIVLRPEYPSLFKVVKICPKTVKVTYPIWNWKSKYNDSGLDRWELGWSEELIYIKLYDSDQRNTTNKIKLDNLIHNMKNRSPIRPKGFRT